MTNPRPTILHVIYSLGRGGAETMLVNVLHELKAYHNIVVTFSPVNYFQEELVCDELICINTPSLWSLPSSVAKLRATIKRVSPQLVHSHLPQSNFAARLATPASIPLITTIHTPISVAVDYKKWYIRWLDKKTFSFRQSTIISVSKQVQNDYFSKLNIRPTKALVIYTFAKEVPARDFVGEKDGVVKLITVGSLRKNKNFHFLIKAFKYISNKKIKLDIYGDGPEYEDLSRLIADTGVMVNLMGQVNNIPGLMNEYDIFVMPSKFEGFSVTVLEAMSQKLPLLLSNIPSFNEQCGDCALYFDLCDPKDFSRKLELLITDKHKMLELGMKGYNRMRHNFTLSHYVQRLIDLYEEEMRGEKL